MKRLARRVPKGIAIRYEKNRANPYRWALTHTWPDDGIGGRATYGGADTYEEALRQAIAAKQLHEAETSKGRNGR